ncbi:MAG: hypothetical protein N2595_09040 [bacterium]|nr:hypothetical protein [bacterium]
MTTIKALLFFILLLVLPCPLFALERAEWLRPTRDTVGTGSVACANGIRDWHIRIVTDRLAGQTPAEWRIRGGRWYSLVDSGYWWAPHLSGWAWQNTLINVVQVGNQFDLFFDPLLAWPGDIFEVTAVISLTKTFSWKVVSNGEGWLDGARWLGQGPDDRLGPREPLGDGVRDWLISVDHPWLRDGVARVDVWLPYSHMGSRINRGGCFEHWSSTPGARPLYYSLSSKGILIAINPVLACGGDEFILRVVRPDASFAHWMVVGLGSEWATGGEWFGQSDYDYVGMSESKPNGVRDWRLRVKSPRLSSPLRWTVRGANTVWEWAAPGKKLLDPSARRMLAQPAGDGMDLFLEPTTERAGDTFYVSAVLPDGSMLNWGVISLHQIRSDQVQWLGQVNEHLSAISIGSTTNALQPWCIAVSHNKFREAEPYRWTVARTGQKWLSPRLTDDDIKQSLPLDVVFSPDGARLYLDPEFARPGTRYEVEALFPDGTLVQWTALANGAEWASAGLWLDGQNEDRVSHSIPPAPDRSPDWVIRISDPSLRMPLAALEITTTGWRWLWPHTRAASPILPLPAGDTYTLHFAPIPSKPSPDELFTIKALFQDGTVRYWQALPPTAN